MGVTAISTDLWWGLIEGRQAGQFDWSYYDRLVALLAQHDMQWVPILLFHQAGGNVNDDFMQTIPLWLWGKLLEAHPELASVRDLQYVSETGDASMEYVSLWADGYVIPYYQRFIAAFRDHYVPRASMLAEINVSLGPAGELRYPSYNSHDWGNYPNRGTLQCYSPLAEQDWRRYLKSRFASIQALNYAFGTRHAQFEAIPMPIADHLFENKEYVYSAWAREFLTWYHGALVAHGRRILEMTCWHSSRMKSGARSRSVSRCRASTGRSVIRVHLAAGNHCGPHQTSPNAWPAESAGICTAVGTVGSS